MKPSFTSHLVAAVAAGSVERSVVFQPHDRYVLIFVSHMWLHMCYRSSVISSYHVLQHVEQHIEIMPELIFLSILNPALFTGPQSSSSLCWIIAARTGGSVFSFLFNSCCMLLWFWTVLKAPPVNVCSRYYYGNQFKQGHESHPIRFSLNFKDQI